MSKGASSEGRQLRGLVVAYLAVLLRVEVPHDDRDLLVRELERELLQRFLHLAKGDHTVVVLVKSAEDVADLPIE